MQTYNLKKFVEDCLSYSPNQEGSYEQQAKVEGLRKPIKSHPNILLEKSKIIELFS